jgi:hypothetical protein
MACPFPSNIETGGISAFKGQHKGTETVLRGFRDKMVVIAHENKSMENHILFVNCVTEIGEELPIVRLRVENLLSLISP